MQWDLKDTQSCRQNKDVSQLKNNLDHSQVVFGLLTTHFKLVYGSKSVLSDSKCEDKFPSWGNLLGVDFSLDGASDRVISPFTTSHWSLLHTDTLTLPSVKLNFMTPPPPRIYPPLPPLINNTISPFNFPSLAHSQPSSRFGLDSYL